MSNVKNNYFSLAYNDLHYLLKYDEDDSYSYNRFSVEAQQVVEKLLKGLIEICDTVSFDEKASVLGTHNLRKLGTLINQHYSVSLNVADLAYLKDFYFEAGYPGDNFTCVDKNTRNKCLQIVMDVIEEVKSLCPDFPKVLDTMNMF